MKKLFSILAAATTLVSGVAFASGECGNPPSHSSWFGGDFYAYGDWLYWTLRRSGLDYINPFRINGDPASNGNGSCLRQTEIDFTSGYRIGAGYVNCCNWGFEINYTHYTSHDSDSFVNPALLVFGSPTRGSTFNQITSSVTTASMRYDVNYKVLDAQIGYDIQTRCFGSLHPYFGGRFAWIDEKTDVRYVSVSLDDTYSLQESTNSKTYGLMTGIDYSNLFICNRIGLFAQLGAAIMYGDVEAGTIQSLTSDTPPPLSSNYNFRVCDHRVLSTLDIAFGLEGVIFQWCGFTLEGQVGYEWHQWLNMIDFINLTGIDVSTYARNTGCFAMEGLYLRLIGRY